LLALVVRLLTLLGLQQTIYYDHPIYDEQVYHTIASKIAEGTYDSRSVYEFSPLPIYLMASVYKVFGPEIAYIRFLNMFFGVVTCAVIYLVGRDLAGRAVGLLSCLIAALYKPLIFYNIVPLKTSLAMLLFALMIWLLLLAMARKPRLGILLLGLTAGLLLNVRPNAVVLIPLLPLLVLWSLHRDRHPGRALIRSLGLYLLGLTVALTPFLARNYLVANKLALTTTQTGQVLYCGNNLNSESVYYRPLPFATSSPKIQGIQFTIEASRREGKKLSHSEASRFWTREVIDMCGENPLATLRRLSLKAFAVFNRFEPGEHYHVGFMEQFVPFLRLPFIPIWLLLPFGMAGMLTSVRGPRARTSLALVFTIYAATMVVFFTATRLRLPLVVILIPFAVLAIREMAGAIRTRQRKKLAGLLGVAAAFFIIGFLPIPGAGNMSEHYNTYGSILNQKGRTQEAQLWWEQSSRMGEPYSTYADLSLAQACIKSGDTQRARSFLERIPDDSFAASHKHMLRGNLFAIAGEIDHAIAAYEQSLRINSGYRMTRRNLIQVLQTVDRDRAMRETREFKRITAFYELN
jgi:4-amino-4-deoxy-L-arabinose transferase-like glycosyltransferase